MKKINTAQILVTMNGDPLKVEDKEQTLGKVLSTLLAEDRTNPTLGWILGKKFATEPSVDLKAEEVVYIKEALKKLEINALYGGQIIDILDGADNKDTPTES